MKRRWQYLTYISIFFSHIIIVLLIIWLIEACFFFFKWAAKIYVRKCYTWKARVFPWGYVWREWWGGTRLKALVSVCSHSTFIFLFTFSSVFTWQCFPSCANIPQVLVSEALTPKVIKLLLQHLFCYHSGTCLWWTNLFCKFACFRSFFQTKMDLGCDSFEPSRLFPSGRAREGLVPTSTSCCRASWSMYPDAGSPPTCVKRCVSWGSKTRLPFLENVYLHPSNQARFLL